MAFGFPFSNPSSSMKTADLRNLNDEDLGLQLKETVKNLFHLRFQSATDRLETPSEIRLAKREVARIRTIIRERGLGIRTNPSQSGKA